jgi:hypothetical protein
VPIGLAAWLLAGLVVGIIVGHAAALGEPLDPPEELLRRRRRVDLRSLDLRPGGHGMTEQEQDIGKTVGEQPEAPEAENEEPEVGSEGLSDEELNKERAGEGEEPHEPERSR